MSEILVAALGGAFIGGLLAVVGGLVQGYFSKRNTKMQIDARKDEQLASFTYQSQQMQKARLIEIRSQYLLPLAEQITKCYELLLNIGNESISIKTWYGDPPNPQNHAFLSGSQYPAYGDLVNKIEEKREILSENLQKLWVLQSKNSDPKLYDLINEAHTKMHNVIMDIYGFRQLAFSAWVSSGTNERVVSLQSTLDKLSDAQLTLSKIQNHIELLLTGS